jgi:serine/threonine-protein kinase
MVHDPGAPLDDDLAVRLTARLGDALTIERELGGGGMSRVFLAHDPSLDRRVVIKVLEGAGGGVSAERFRQEMLLGASLQHPHIVPVLAAGDLDGVPWYSMPWIEGRSLRDRLGSDGQLALRDALRILRDVARACVHAHSRGIVHRDLKPENVMLTGDAAVIIDFGIAKALIEANQPRTARDGLTRVGFTVGTPTYMAPEQAAADPGLDHRADIYAFGIMAFELLAGVPPFRGATSQQLLKAHLADPVPDLGRLRPGLPPGLVTLINDCLAKAPDDRPGDAEQLVDRIEAILAGATGESVAAARRTPWIAVGAVAMVAATLLLLGGPFRRPAPALATPAPSVAVLPFIPRGDDSSSSWLATGLGDDVAAQLLALGGVQVAPRLAVEQLGLSPLSPRQLGETLGVRTLLDGVVRRDGDELRVIAQLVDAESGAVLWTGSYRRGPGDAGHMVDDIVSSVRGALLVAGDTVSGTRRGRDPAAYADYLQGRGLLASRQPPAIIKAVEHFEAAVRRDSTFAAAWAALADALLLLPLYAGVPFADVATPAADAVGHALAHDAELAEALITRGRLRAGRWEWALAEADLRRAMARAPSADAEQAVGEILLVTGRYDAAHRAFERTRVLAPTAAVPIALSGVAAALAGQGESARRALETAARVDSVAPSVHLLVGAGWLFLGEVDLGLASLDVAARLAPDQPLLRGIRAQALALTGRSDEARRLRDALAVESGRAGVAGGLVHAELAIGDSGAALAALERAVRERDPIFTAEPLGTVLFERLRGSPRFDAVRRQVGLLPPEGGPAGS